MTLVALPLLAATASLPALGAECHPIAAPQYQTLAFAARLLPGLKPDMSCSKRAARSNEFPWMVEIEFDAPSTRRCGGTVIGRRLILTARHCLPPDGDSSPVRVTFGSVDLKGNVVPMELKSPVIHRLGKDDDYYSAETVTGKIKQLSYPDFALLTADVPIWIEPVPLLFDFPMQQTMQRRTATILGWGLNETQQSETQLKVKEIQLLTAWQCASHYRDLPQDLLCGWDETGVSCSGDSGGPVLVSNGGKLHEVAIIGAGYGCEPGMSAGLYPWLGAAKEFIEKYQGP